VIKVLLKNNSQRIRLALQTVFLLLAVYLFAGLIAGKFHSAHAFCPYASVCFGALKLRMAGHMVFLFTTAIVTGLLIGIVTMFIGRKFCGYICPVGTLQEYLFKLRSKRYRLLKRVPFFYERKFRVAKYFVLAITFVLVLLGISPLFMNFCPVLTLSRLPNIVIPGLILWIVIIAGGLLTDRFWCRFLCPYAALLNLFQKLSRLFGFKRLLIKRNLEKCIDCCNCIRNCPMNIDLQQGEYIKDDDCIHCLICAAACPKENTINEENTSRDCYE